MKAFRQLVLSMAIAAVGGPSVAAQAVQHTEHHPAANTTVEPASPNANPAQPMMDMSGPGMAGMDAQMQSMMAMHVRMMKARTPAERQSLMAEHMAVMQSGMNMLDHSSSDGQAGMGCDMTMHAQSMEKRMAMMQMMMQMMMDRLPEPQKK